MARYREGETALTGADTLTNTLFAGAAMFGLVLGIGFAIAGWRGRQYWLMIWGAGLALCSIGYLGYTLFY